MDGRERVIKGLECCREMNNPPGYRMTGCCECPYYDSDHNNNCVKRLKDDAIVLLKAQEPIAKPMLLQTNPHLTNGASYLCGNCGGSFFHQKVNYCPWCGKAVRWGG